MNFLKLPLNQCGKLVLMRLTDSPILPRLGRGAAAAGLVRDRQGDALVERRRQQGRLAQARMADHGDPLRVQVLVVDQVIDGPVNVRVNPDL